MRSSRQFSFLNGTNKLVFVRMYGSTIIGLVGPPYPYCSLVAFCAFGAFLCFFCAFLCFIARTKILTSKNQLTKQRLTNIKQDRQQSFARTNF